VRSGGRRSSRERILWGTGNPIPWSDPFYRPGDNLFTDSLISWDPDTGKMNWYHQYTPGDMWDYDEEGSHVLIDAEIGGQVHIPMRHVMASSTQWNAPTGSP
jgi:alcohol dehydrogenase (cytochrome c)